MDVLVQDVLTNFSKVIKQYEVNIIFRIPTYLLKAIEKKKAIFVKL